MNSFTKLADGTWGARVTGAETTGATVTITTRNGATKDVVLGALVSSNDWGSTFAIVPQARPTTAQVGDLTALLALFDRASRNLKWPKVVLEGVRVTRKQDGTLKVTGTEKRWNERFGKDDYVWYGTVALDGTYAPSRAAPAGVVDQLKALAANPANEAGRLGRLHGNCVFCAHDLSHDNSTTVGYGPVCADNYGLPWGVPACEAV